MQGLGTKQKEQIIAKDRGKGIPRARRQLAFREWSISPWQQEIKRKQVQMATLREFPSVFSLCKEARSSEMG